MAPGPDSTIELLRRWHGGDRAALELLLREELPWLEARIRKRLGPLLRSREETCDFLQESLVELLSYGPRFLLRNRIHFRALLSRIAENVLRGRHDRYTALRRQIHRERPLSSDTVVDLDLPAAVTDPGDRAMANENEARLRLTLEILPHEEREVLLLRQWDGLSFEKLGERLGTTPDAARMRYHRALSRLGKTLRLLEEGRLGEVLDDAGEEIAP